MFEFVRDHIDVVRTKGHEWQLKVAWKAIALVALLSLAAHAAYERSFDREGLAQLAAKGSAPIKERGRRP